MLPWERGHSGLTHSKPPPVLMQVVPRLQLCCWLKHSSTSAKNQTARGMWERAAGKRETCQANSPLPGYHSLSRGYTLLGLFIWSPPLFVFLFKPPTEASRPEGVFCSGKKEVRSFTPRGNALSPKGANERALTDISARLHFAVTADKGAHALPTSIHSDEQLKS